MSLGPARFRIACGAAAGVLAFVGVFSVAGHAQQPRTVANNVYSAAQAQRGQQLYAAQCVACHGAKLEGAIGPMLAGKDFVTHWGGKSLTELVQKIQKTMPLQSPGSLNEAQSIDLTAYMLQESGYPVGQADLAAATLATTTFPAAAPAAAASAGGMNLSPTMNLAQFMRAITFPNANILFNTQLKPADTRMPTPMPFDYILWGMTQYGGWQAVDQAAMTLAETSPMFLMPGRRCENGRPVPLENALFKKTTEDLITLAREFQKVAATRNSDAVAAMADRLNQACDACHKVYRDVPTEGKSVSEGGVSADRCRNMGK
jgi:mono/diheme cytochrome c family protein